MKVAYNKRVFGLDFMRAVAILLVVFSHISWIIPNSKGLIPELMSLTGFIGVEIFFVLSGFLIGRIIYKIYVSEDFNRSKIIYFWIRRWFRTLPNYYLVLLINILIFLYLGIDFPENTWLYGFFVHNFSSELPKFFPESWSLSIEEFAYIIGPFLLYLTLFIKTKVSKNRIFFYVTLLIVVLFTLTKVVYSHNEVVQNMNHWNVNLKAVVIYRIDAIYFGVLAAHISEIKPEFWKKRKYIMFGLGGILFLFVNILIPSKQVFIENYPFFWNVLYLPLNSIAIMLTLPLLSQINSANMLLVRPITFISLISYSMYLLHYSIILQLLKYFLPSEDLPKFDSIVYIMVYLSLTLVLSYIFYKFYEKPFTDLRDSKLIRDKFK